MTKREMFAEIKSLLSDNAEVVAFCDHEIALLSQKAIKKPTKTQVENVSYTKDILAVLTDKPVSISTLVEMCPSLAGLSNQRVSALLTPLKNKGTIVRTEVKGKAMFALAMDRVE